MQRLPALVAIMAVVACPAVAQTVLRPGQTVQGELMASDSTLPDGSHYDCFTIQTRSGQTLQIEQTSAAFDSYLQAGTGTCAGNLSNLVSDDDSGGGLNARLQIQGDGGVLTVRANSLSAGLTGRYALTVAEVGQGTANRQPAAPAAPAAPAQTAVTGGDPFDTRAVFVGFSERESAWFVLPVEYRPDGLRRLQVLKMFITQQSLGPGAGGVEDFVDALLTDYLIDCSSNRFKRTSATGYLRRANLGSGSVDEPFETPEEHMIMSDVVKVGCHPEQFDWQTGFPDYASKVARTQRMD